MTHAKEVSPLVHRQGEQAADLLDQRPFTLFF